MTLQQPMKPRAKSYEPVTIERIKELKNHEHLSDEEAQAIIDTLKTLVHLSLEIANNSIKDEQ